ncbi:MAG: hypothetical protein QMD04_10590 [Anaerolineales bacterium]|nr:hypothetical protein [Anaerolineales bacterium]
MEQEGGWDYMDIHFTAVDPRGLTISCAKDTWFDKILPIRRWVDGANWEDDVIQAIQDPIFICTDQTFANRACYYKRPGETSAYMKVVVEFEGLTGRIITAFETDHLKSGEKYIWPTSKD